MHERAVEAQSPAQGPHGSGDQNAVSPELRQMVGLFEAVIMEHQIEHENTGDTSMEFDIVNADSYQLVVLRVPDLQLHQFLVGDFF